ncbi:hypothetical protein Patl1_32369 [Pistacia atlantica]|uniref:Uncharacterized protein n=1 Tax=Pistacia atlantica TaxID=434234 RepID=A0ACC1ALS2_9ROSI|nr:hypothetical protein Patl1_32369 [Pistacia atlantica]
MIKVEWSIQLRPQGEYNKESKYLYNSIDVDIYRLLDTHWVEGTVALLTYVLREWRELSTTTCVTFAPAACMTWELAEPGNDFITCVINGADLVPTFFAASVDVAC